MSENHLHSNKGPQYLPLRAGSVFVIQCDSHVSPDTFLMEKKDICWVVRTALDSLLHHLTSGGFTGPGRAVLFRSLNTTLISGSQMFVCLYPEFNCLVPWLPTSETG